MSTSSERLSKAASLKLIRQNALKLRIQNYLMGIEEEVGPNYQLTLVARYKVNDGKDADIVLTSDDLDAAIATIQKMKARSPLPEV